MKKNTSLLKTMYQLSADFLGWKDRGILRTGGMDDEGAIEKSGILEKAEELGPEYLTINLWGTAERVKRTWQTSLPGSLHKLPVDRSIYNPEITDLTSGVTSVLGFDSGVPPIHASRFSRPASVFASRYARIYVFLRMGALR